MENVFAYKVFFNCKIQMNPYVKYANKPVSHAISKALIVRVAMLILKENFKIIVATALKDFMIYLIAKTILCACLVTIHAADVNKIIVLNHVLHATNKLFIIDK